MVKFSKPGGPFRTVIATKDGETVATIRKVPHNGYQVTIQTGYRWQGQFGKTNVAFAKTIHVAKAFVKSVV